MGRLQFVQTVAVEMVGVLLKIITIVKKNQQTWNKGSSLRAGGCILVSHAFGIDYNITTLPLSHVRLPLTQIIEPFDTFSVVIYFVFCYYFSSLY